MAFQLVRRLSRLVVLVLLTWTAVDVLYPAVCGLDELQPVTGQSVSAGTDESTTPPITADDCFCCSHNVNFTSTISVAVAVLSGTEQRTFSVQSPRWTSFPSYHPPRLRS